MALTGDEVWSGGFVRDADGRLVAELGSGSSGISANMGSTGAGTNVSDTASSTTILAANTSRKRAIIFNDSTSDLYIKYGTTASLTDFAVKIPGDEAWEVEGYTGRIDGIWSADASGAARVTEIT